MRQGRVGGRTEVRGGTSLTPKRDSTAHSGSSGRMGVGSRVVEVPHNSRAPSAPPEMLPGWLLMSLLLSPISQPPEPSPQPIGFLT